MRIWLRRLTYAALAIAVLIQFIRPAQTNPSVNPHNEISAVVPMNPNVTSILNRSCNDCHSNNTSWPWYSKVAPVSWLVTRDVNEGRRELNLSEWGTYAPQRRSKLLAKMCTEAREGEMPMLAYSVMHPKARLTTSDIQALCSWAGGGNAEARELSLSRAPAN